MDIVLSSLKWQFVLVYHHGIVKFSKTPDEYIDQVRQVLRLLNDTPLTYQLKKCEFLTNRLYYHGQIIKPGRLGFSSHTVGVTDSLQAPYKITKFCSFLRLCNVFWRILPSSARITATLIRKL